MMTNRNLMAVSVLIGVLTAAATLRADSGIRRNVGFNTGAGFDIEVVGQIYLTQRANHAMMVEVREPANADWAPWPDVLLDVFSDTGSTLLGHGVHIPGGHETTEFNASILLPAVSKSRTVVVVVRGRSGSTRQVQVPVSAFELGGSSWSLLGHYDVTSGARVITGDLPANTYVQTVENPGGTDDTILMVLNDDVPIAMDDNSGVDLMSFISLPTACPRFSCSILPARRGHALAQAGSLPARGAPNAGTVTVVWDEGAYKKRADMDGDGLGDALELALGTCTDPNNPANDPDTDGDGIRDCMDKDVDGDGIPDSYEVLGKADESGKQNKVANLTKFPFYGADPLLQDLFVEVDWFPNCKDPDPAVCAGGHTPPGPGNKDANQFSAQTAHDYVRRFSADLRVHLDIGNGFVTAGGPPATDAHGNYGNWGGAEILPDSTPDKYATGGFKTGFSEARKGLFVHLVADGRQGGKGWAGKWARCNAEARNCVHETGHILGLGHWGEWSGDISGKANCKPNYISVMNYATNESALIGGGGPNDLPAFSHGRHLGAPLNPSAMNEAAGLTLGGAPDTNRRVLDVMEQVYRFQVNATTGGIDWDQDGAIQPGGGANVRAFINRYASGSGARTGGCDPGQTGSESIGLGAVSTLVATPSGPTIYPLNSPILRALTCATLGSDSCEEWSSVDLGIAGLISSLYAKTVTTAGQILVFEDSKSHLLRYAGRSPSGKGVGGLVGGPPVAGPPAAIIGPNTGVGVDGRIRVYAPVTTGSGGAARTTLRLWEYDPSQDVWITRAAEQYWAGSIAPIEMVPGTGVGLTVGSRSDVAGAQLFAAIPSRNSSNGNHELVLATVRETPRTMVITLPAPSPPLTVDFTIGEWEVVQSPSNSIWQERGGVPPAADVGRVGLAFLPADPVVWNDPNGGRFYISWQTYNNDSPPRAVALVSSTRGNVLPLLSAHPERTPHGLYFTGDSVFSPYNGSEDSWPEGMVLAATRGRVVGLGGPRYRFFPNADGASRMQQSDHDDLAHIRRKLSCAIRGCSNLTN